MNKFAILAAVALTAGSLGMASTAFAAGPTFASADANKDGSVSWEEAQGVFPTLTQDLFTKADANGDAKLDEAEFGSLLGLSAGLATSGDASSAAPSSSAAK